MSLESLLEVNCWDSNTMVGNTVNIYTSTPIGQQSRTRIQGTTETPSDISNKFHPSSVSELSSVLLSEQPVDYSDPLERVKEKAGLKSSIFKCRFTTKEKG